MTKAMQQTNIEEALKSQDKKTVQKWIDEGGKLSDYKLMDYYTKDSDEAFILFLMENGADIDAKNKDGLTALIRASFNGHLEIAKELIKSGADIEAKNKDGATALMFASLDGHLEVVKELIKSGADIDAKYKYGMTALMFASFAGHLEVVRELIKSGADIEAKYKDGRTALMFASSNGHLEVVKELIKSGADIDAKYKDGWTALMFASFAGHLEVVKELIKSGAAIEAEAKNKYGRTALMAASHNGHLEIAKELIKSGAAIDAKSEDGTTALMFASLDGHLEVVRELIKSGADIEAKDKNDVTALMYASLDGHLEVVKELIKSGADIEAKDKNGATALMVASRNGHLEVVKELIKSGAAIDAKDKNGATALMAASRNGHLEIAKELIKSGAAIDAKDKDGRTALMEALMTASHNGHLETVKELIKSGAAIDAKDKDGRTALMEALMTASHNGHLKVVKELIKSGARKDKDIMIKISQLYHDALKTTASKETEKIRAYILHVDNRYKNFDITKSDYKDVVMSLQDSIDKRDNRGNTPLIYAVIYEKRLLVDVLIEAGATLDIQNKKGFMAIDYASGDIKKSLRKAGAMPNKIDKIKLEKDRKRYIDKRDKEIADLIKEGKKSYKNSFNDKKNPELAIVTRFKYYEFFRMVNKKNINFARMIADDSTLDISDMIDQGIPINQQTDEGKSELMLLCEQERFKEMEALLKAGADLSLKDYEGRDIWDYAAELDDNKAFELLKKYENYQNHHPKEFVKLLKNFTNDTPLKYTTHDWDFDLASEYDDFDGFIKALKKKFKELDALKEYVPTLYEKIEAFLFSKDGLDEGLGWSALPALKEEKNPFAYRLKKPLMIDGENIELFGEYIKKVFKQKIEVRRESEALERIFEYIDDECLADDQVMKCSHLKGKQFYTDVQSLKKALEKIFVGIKARKEFKEIEVSAKKEDDFIDISICHIGSFSDISSEDLQKEVEDGDFYDIKEKLRNLCDWRVENSYQEKSYSLHYLHEKRGMFIEALSQKPKGFTHVLRFYI